MRGESGQVFQLSQDPDPPVQQVLPPRERLLQGLLQVQEAVCQV